MSDPSDRPVRGILRWLMHVQRVWKSYFEFLGCIYIYIFINIERDRYICWISEFDACSVPIRNSTLLNCIAWSIQGYIDYSKETWKILRSAVSILIYLPELCTFSGVRDVWKKSFIPIIIGCFDLNHPVWACLWISQDYIGCDRQTWTSCVYFRLGGVANMYLNCFHIRSSPSLRWVSNMETCDTVRRIIFDMLQVLRKLRRWIGGATDHWHFCLLSCMSSAIHMR